MDWGSVSTVMGAALAIGGVANASRNCLPQVVRERSLMMAVVGVILFILGFALRSWQSEAAALRRSQASPSLQAPAGRAAAAADVAHRALPSASTSPSGSAPVAAPAALPAPPAIASATATATPMPLPCAAPAAAPPLASTSLTVAATLQSEPRAPSPAPAPREAPAAPLAASGSITVVAPLESELRAPSPALAPSEAPAGAPAETPAALRQSASLAVVATPKPEPRASSPVPAAEKSEEELFLDPIREVTDVAQVQALWKGDRNLLKDWSFMERCLEKKPSVWVLADDSIVEAVIELCIKKYPTLECRHEKTGQLRSYSFPYPHGKEPLRQVLQRKPELQPEFLKRHPEWKKFFP